MFLSTFLRFHFGTICDRIYNTLQREAFIREPMPPAFQLIFFSKLRKTINTQCLSISNTTNTCLSLKQIYFMFMDSLISTITKYFID